MFVLRLNSQSFIMCYVTIPRLPYEALALLQGEPRDFPEVLLLVLEKLAGN